jgi:hypothetical protein
MTRFLRTDDGKLIKSRIAMPRTVSCPICKYSYVRGLEGEARQHAAYHASYTWQRRPRSEPRLAAYAGDVRVTPRALNGCNASSTAARRGATAG